MKSLTSVAPPKPTKKKPMTKAGNGAPDAWREFPIETMNDAEVVGTVDDRCIR